MRRIVRIAVVVAVGFFATGCDPDDIADGVCDAGELCLWEHAYQGGLLADPGCCDGEWAGGYGNYGQNDYWGTSTSPNDKTSSIRNRVTSRNYTTMYEHAVGGGTKICTQPGLYIADLGAALFLTFDNDSLSSSFSSNYNPCI